MGGKSRGRRGVTLDEWLQAVFMQHISMSVVSAEVLWDGYDSSYQSEDDMDGVNDSCRLPMVDISVLRCSNETLSSTIERTEKSGASIASDTTECPV
jgi:hypothetical protein